MEILIGEPCRLYVGKNFASRQFIGVYYYVGKGLCTPAMSDFGDIYTMKADYIVPHEYYNDNYGYKLDPRNPYSRIDDRYFSEKYSHLDFEMFKRENITDKKTNIEHDMEFAAMVLAEEEKYQQSLNTL